MNSNNQLQVLYLLQTGAVSHIAERQYSLSLFDANTGAATKRQAIMKVQENICANGQTIRDWRTGVRAAVMTALAAVCFLAMWPSISAGVAPGGRNPSGIQLGDVFVAGSSEHDDRAKEGERIAKNYGDWLSAAHRNAAVTAAEQPLPAQF